MSGSNFNNTDNKSVNENDAQSLTNKTVNGVMLDSAGAGTQALFDDGAYKVISASGVSGVQSGTDINVDNSNPSLPVINAGSNLATKTVYDPTAVNGDAFSMGNMSETGTEKILTSTERTEIAANTAKVTNQTHTGDVTGATALTIAANAVDNSKAADMATQTIKGRTTAGSGDPEDLTPGQVRTILNVEDGAQVNDDLLQDIYDRNTPTITVTDAIGSVVFSNAGSTEAPVRLAPNATVPSTGLAAGALHMFTDDQLYSYNSTRSKFLSTAEMTCDFGANGPSDNEYMEIMGDITNAGAGYIMRKDITIIAITGNSTGGLATKGFTLEGNGSSIGTFSFTSNQIVDNTTDIDMAAGDRLHLFIDAAGGSVVNPSVTIFYKYRI